MGVVCTHCGEKIFPPRSTDVKTKIVNSTSLATEKVDETIGHEQRI